MVADLRLSLLDGAQAARRLLRWGRVAQVVGSEIVSRATYYSGTTWSNVWLPQAHGWTVTRELWSGPSTKTTVRYALDGHRGEITIRGRAYDDGVILADAAAPGARAVRQFVRLRPRPRRLGQLGRPAAPTADGRDGGLAARRRRLADAAVGISTGAVDRLLAEESVIRLAPGGSLTVTDSGPQRSTATTGTSPCAAAASPVTVHGHCASLAVSGIDGVVTVDSVDAITLDGIGNHVTYHSGTQGHHRRNEQHAAKADVGAQPPHGRITVSETKITVIYDNPTDPEAFEAPTGRPIGSRARHSRVHPVRGVEGVAEGGRLTDPGLPDDRPRTSPTTTPPALPSPRRRPARSSRRWVRLATGGVRVLFSDVEVPAGLS